MQLGVHATALLPPQSIGSDVVNDEESDEMPVYFLPNPTFTGRFGIVEGLELGAQIGSHGTLGSIKYGFFPHESPFQLSVLGGAGVWGYSAIAGATIPSFDIGALAGYEIENAVLFYGGARYYLVGAESSGTLGNVRSTNVIGGAEILPNNLVSVPIELNYSFSNTFNEILSDLSEEDILIAWPSVNAGITFTF
ncbi:MAG: hypothetical protein ACOC0B_01645 [bacterium]